MDFFATRPLAARWAADLLVVAHGLFVVWVMAGGFAVWRRRWLAAVHLPAAAWGVWIEWSGGLCPLTPLENALRRVAGQGGYEGGFVEHYLIPMIYPAGLTAPIQWVLGAAVLAVNLAVYGALWRQWQWRRRGSRRP